MEGRMGIVVTRRGAKLISFRLLLPQMVLWSGHSITRHSSHVKSEWWYFCCRHGVI